jgi:hypothetical protein
VSAKSERGHDSVQPASVETVRGQLVEREIEPTMAGQLKRTEQSGRCGESSQGCRIRLTIAMPARFREALSEKRTIDLALRQEGTTKRRHQKVPPT